MDKRKIIKICAIIICALFAFAFLEITIRWLSNQVSNISDKIEENKQQKELYNSDAEKTNRQIKLFIENIYTAIEDKDYNYVLISLNEDYNNYMFNNDVNNLKQYIEEKIILGDSREVTRISQNGGKYQVLVGIENANNYISQTFTVDVLNENSCTLMFGEYTKFQKREESANFSNLIYDITYYYETPELMSYVLEVKNISTTEINLEILNSSLVASTGNTFNRPTCRKS